MIIDCHGHYTNAPHQHQTWRELQIQALQDGFTAPEYPKISDDELMRSVADAQIQLLKDRCTDLMLLSPQATAMNHHRGTPRQTSSGPRTAMSWYVGYARSIPGST